MDTMFCLLFLFPLFSSLHAHNFLVVSPVFGYSHMKFMNKMADTLADGGHQVTVLQFYNYEHFGKIRMAKNKNIEIIDYHDKESPSNTNQSASNFKYLWNTEMINNPITSSFKMSSVLLAEMKAMCTKMFSDKELHQWILSKKFDGYVSETFDFCGLLLGDYLKMNLIPVFSATKNLASVYAMGEPSVLNFQPSSKSAYDEDQSISDRINDIIAYRCQAIAFSRLYDKQHSLAVEILGDEVRPWQQILQTATFYFSNENDYISFPTASLSKHVHIGGFTIDPPKHLKLDEEYDKILNLRGSTVLISFGTVIRSADMPESFKNGIIQMFKNLPDTTFIWKYEEDDEDFKKRLPTNVFLRKWLPQPALLADDRLKMFVTHGGLGSTLEVAYAGIPSLMIPVFADQMLNAKMLSRHGGAKMFNKYDLEKPDELTAAIREIISDQKFNKAAHLTSEILKSQPVDPKVNLLRHMEFAAKFGRVHSLEPYNVRYNFVQYYMLDAIAVLASVFLIVLYTVYLVIKFIFRRVFKIKSKQE